MHRIDGPGATITNQFTEGDPGASVPATVVTGDWLNAVQEEIAGVIEGAGDTLDKPDNGQLLAAIQAIASAATGWTTGDVKLTMKTTADAGWIMCNDGTIGSATSGGTTRANADTEDLFTLLWNNVSNAWAPVSGGRGASAAADFAADKTISLTKMLGRALAMAGAGSLLTSRALGETVGAENHTLTEAEMPLHGHPWRNSNTNEWSWQSDVTGGFATSNNGQVNRAAIRARRRQPSASRLVAPVAVVPTITCSRRHS